MPYYKANQIVQEKMGQWDYFPYRTQEKFCPKNLRGWTV